MPAGWVGLDSAMIFSLIKVQKVVFDARAAPGRRRASVA
jgi:hypothetical protein